MHWYHTSESGSRPHLQETLRGLKLTRQHEDFELKKGLFCMLSNLSCDLAAVKVMAEEKVIRSLLSFVTRNDKVEKYLWNPAQFEELQLLVSNHNNIMEIKLWAELRFDCSSYPPSNYCQTADSFIISPTKYIIVVSVLIGPLMFVFSGSILLGGLHDLSGEHSSAHACGVVH